jgi:hypothetical protein
MFGPTGMGRSVANAAQKVQNRRSLSAWKTDPREINFMPQYLHGSAALVSAAAEIAIGEERVAL